MRLDECLPAELRQPTTTITKLAAGLSDAGVYRVDADQGAFVLKVSTDAEPLADWQRKLGVQRLAADDGLAPAVVHADADRRAVLSAFVLDRSFMAQYGNPQTCSAAVEQLGRTVRRIHVLSLPLSSPFLDPRDFLATLRSSIGAGFALPTFVRDAIDRGLSEPPPVRERPLVLSHNDLNPSNLVYDGANLLILDWDVAGANDPFYDLAVLSIFLRMDRVLCLALLSAYDGETVTEVPPGFGYNRRLGAVLAGSMLMHLAQQRGHPGATGAETFESTLSLADFYQQLRAGAVSVATADGQWQFGMALVKESTPDLTTTGAR
jgi:aminoglycoside phosphotransferase (APT) family kinase protein